MNSYHLLMGGSLGAEASLRDWNVQEISSILHTKCLSVFYFSNCIYLKNRGFKVYVGKFSRSFNDRTTSRKMWKCELEVQNLPMTAAIHFWQRSLYRNYRPAKVGVTHSNQLNFFDILKSRIIKPIYNTWNCEIITTGEWEGCAWEAAHNSAMSVWIWESLSLKLFSTHNLCLYFVFMLVRAENPLSHKYVVAKGTEVCQWPC